MNRERQTLPAGVTAERRDAPHTQWELERTFSRAGLIEASVLISGGSPKQRATLARSIHRRRGGSPSSFRVIDCGVMAGADLERVLRECSYEGTCYIEQVDLLSPALQRLLAASLEVNRRGCLITGMDDAAAVMRGGTFSEALFYRLNVLHATIAPRQVMTGRRGRGSDFDPVA